MRRARRDGATAVAVVALVVMAATGCAPQSPDRSSWSDQANTALEDTASEVATVSLLLRLEDQGKVPGKYQQVVAQDSETAVGKTLARFAGEQPPPREDATYTEVTSLISDASDLLARVRIAVVRRDTDLYAPLQQDLQDTHDELTGAADELADAGAR